MRIPEEKLVYFYCRSIFTGTNAEVRKLKKVRQLLKHKASIRGFIDEYGLENVSVVAKKLLTERIFETSRRARRRFPELFESSEADEVGGTAPETELLSFETAAAREALGTPEEEDHDYSPVNGHDKHDGSLRTITPEELSPRSRRPSAERRQVILPSSFPRRDHVTRLIHHSNPNAIINGSSSNLPWRLHPVHLPFRTQHRILTFVQSTLEECCRDFGQTWAPHLMKARKWDDPESIELTEWIKRMSKCTKDLPPSATRPIAGKSLNQVLSDTSILRHTAVHRVPTNVERIMGMLHAAHDFALALKDTARAPLIKRIEEQLAASINILFQGSGLLQQKVSGRREVTAKGRIEMDKLERLCTTNVKESETAQRAEAISAINDVITDPQHDASLRSLNYGGKNQSTVPEQATLENGTLKTGRVASLVRLFEHRGS